MALARFNYYRIHPHAIHRHDNGQVNKPWMIYDNVTAVIIGGAVATVAFMLVRNIGIASDEIVVFFSSLVGISADKIFIRIQEKLDKKAEEHMDEF